MRSWLVDCRETRAAHLSVSSTITGFKQELRRLGVDVVFHTSLEFTPKYQSSFDGFKASSIDTRQSSLGRQYTLCYAAVSHADITLLLIDKITLFYCSVGPTRAALCNESYWHTVCPVSETHAISNLLLTFFPLVQFWGQGPRTGCRVKL